MGLFLDIPDSDEVYGSNTIRKDDTGVLKLRAPDLHSGFWGRSGDDNIVPLGADDPANAVPARLTEVRSNDTRSLRRSYRMWFMRLPARKAAQRLRARLRCCIRPVPLSTISGRVLAMTLLSLGLCGILRMTGLLIMGWTPSVANSGSTDEQVQDQGRGRLQASCDGRNLRIQHAARH